MSFEQIPAHLKAVRGWLVWKYVQVGEETKPRKMPIYVGGGRRVGVQGSEQDRKKLATFDEALARLQRGGVDGLGLALLPEWGLVALDFDDCVRDGVVEGEVAALVADTYAELSPSGKGVRAYMTGVCPDRKSRRSEEHTSELQSR